MEDRFKNSNTFGQFSTGNTFGKDNYPYVQSDFQPSKTSWKNLYNENHTPKSNIAYHYSQNVDSSRLNIRHPNPDGDSVMGGIVPRRHSDVGSREPYIVSDIPIDSGQMSVLPTPFGDGRSANFGSREFPIMRSTRDVERISKFLTSPAGLLFIGKQEALGAQGMTIVHDRRFGVLKKKRQYRAFYNPLSTLMSVGPTNRFAGYGPNLLVERDFPAVGETEFFPNPVEPGFEYGIQFIKSTNNNSATLKGGIDHEQSVDTIFGKSISTNPSEIEAFFSGLSTDPTNPGTIVGPDVVTRQNAGDPHTILPIENEELSDDLKSQLQSEYGDGSMEHMLGTENQKKLEGTPKETYGMPFYFKDLRNNTYIAFRAYIDGITENIAPSWTATNYVGRSEPVYVYERSERDISFNLKLFAHTTKELQMIYKKMDRLTSLCYPEYHEDEFLLNRTRMKPPMTKFRLGELFGTNNNELIGFLKSLTYSIPDEGVWETKYGKRVPKYITAAINYQVIHATAPNIETQFYGYTGVN
tara:strand:- start:371 stop:1948 length:1578 start_codon:yes stop_codon:yes gene_type:complete